jgi:hypothetical protein
MPARNVSWHLGDFGLVALALGVVAFSVVTVERKPAGLAPKGTAATAAAATAPMPKGPLTAWIGDATLAGDPGVATSVSRARTWSWSFDFQAASGFAPAGAASSLPFSQPIYSRVAAVIAKHPRLVVLDGGQNDAAHQAAITAVRNGAVSAVTRLKKGLPSGVPIVLIGPTWTDGNPPTRLLEVRDALLSVSTHFHLPFIDPLTERWVTGDQVSLDGSGGSGTAKVDEDADGHLTAAGISDFAKHLNDDLVRLNVAVTAG